MDPCDEPCIRVRAAGDHPGSRSLQIGHLDVIMLPDDEPVELPGRQQLHHMAVAPEFPGEPGLPPDMGLQELGIDTAAEEVGDGDIKFLGVHVVDQIHQHLLGAALAQVMDQKEDLLFHLFTPGHSLGILLYLNNYIC